jgi:hypothetical protein
MCIEYDGIQHFEPRSKFGGQEQFDIQKSRDLKKDNYCKDNKIKLFRISYKDYNKLNSILNSILNENIVKNFNEFINFNKIV